MPANVGTVFACCSLCASSLGQPRRDLVHGYRMKRGTCSKPATDTHGIVVMQLVDKV